MGKYIKKFDSVSNYEAYITSNEFLLPNVSYIDEIGGLRFTDEEETSYRGGMFSGVITVGDTSETYRLMGDAYTPMVSKMVLDGEEVEAVSTMVFATEGTHTYEVYFDAKLDSLFFECRHLTELNVSNLKTDNVTSMFNTFNYCEKLHTIDISKWNTSKVTNMDHMFGACTGLTSIVGIEDIDTSNVTDMKWMFNTCTSLYSLDLEKWDTSNVTNMSYMFGASSNLSTVRFSEWNTSNVTDLSYMFINCSNLSSINMSRWDVNKVTTMAFMFGACVNLNTLLLPNNAKNITDLSATFMQCMQLTSLDLRGWDISNVTSMTYTFTACSSLTSIYIDSAINSSVVFEATFSQVAGNGTLYYNSNYDYSKIFALLPTTWSTVALN